MSEPLLIERGPLLNFSGGGFWAPHPHRLELVYYRQAENRFQAMKTLFLRYPDDQMPSSKAKAHDWFLAVSPADAKSGGRGLAIETHLWDEFAPRAMLEALLFKFTQNSGARYELSMTGDRPLVEHRPDTIWGDNLNGTGKNLMGLALMHIREKLCR